MYLIGISVVDPDHLEAYVDLRYRTYWYVVRRNLPTYLPTVGTYLFTLKVLFSLVQTIST